MKPHTTHFDDCGCKSTDYELKISKLREVLESTSVILRGFRLDPAEKAIYNKLIEALEATKD